MVNPGAPFTLDIQGDVALVIKLMGKQGLRVAALAETTGTNCAALISGLTLVRVVRAPLGFIEGQWRD